MEVILTKELVQADLDALGKYKTADVDALIRKYVKSKADASLLMPYVLSHQQLHRIAYYVPLKQRKTPLERMEFIHNNLNFSDWWHTDELINFVADMDFGGALTYAKAYVVDDDPFIRRWGYVLFISKLCRGKAGEIIPLFHNDEHYYVQMGQAWLIAELAVFEPEFVLDWMPENGLAYNINGKAIQKICDSFRISKEWKEKFKALRPGLKIK